MEKEMMSWNELKSLIDAVYERHWMKDIRVDEEACGPDAPQKLCFCKGKKAKICKVVKLVKDVLSVDVLVFDTPEPTLAVEVKLMVYGVSGTIYSVAVESVHRVGAYEAREEGWDIPGFSY